MSNEQRQLRSHLNLKVVPFTFQKIALHIIYDRGYTDEERNENPLNQTDRDLV